MTHQYTCTRNLLNPACQRASWRLFSNDSNWIKRALVFPCIMTHALLALDCLETLSIIAKCQCLDLRRCNGMTIRCRKTLKGYTECLLPPTKTYCLLIYQDSKSLFRHPFKHARRVDGPLRFLETFAFNAFCEYQIFQKPTSSLCVQQISTVAFYF